jgi:protein TonB
MLDVAWSPGWASEASGCAAAPAGFDMAAIRPHLVQLPPTSEASARTGGSWGAVISTALHGGALTALLIWATPVAEPPSPELVTVEIVADVPTPTVHEAQPPSEPAHPAAAPPPVAEALPPVAQPPIAEPTAAPAAQAAPPPVVENPPPVAEPSPPPVADPPPPVADPAPSVAVTSPPVQQPLPPAPQTAPPVAEVAPQPVVEAPPPVAELAWPPVAQKPPAAFERPPITEPSPRPSAQASPPLRPAPTASPAPRRVRALPPSEKTRPEPRRMRPETATAESEPTRSTSEPAKAFAPAISSEEAQAYRGTVFGRIAAQKRYPEAARERGPHGVAILSFSIGGSGQIVGATLAQSAGDSILDAEALATVRRASPFPPPPAGAPRNFSVPLSYRVR